MKEGMRPAFVLLVVGAIAFIALIAMDIGLTGDAVHPSLLSGPLLKCRDTDGGINPFVAGWVRMRVDERNLIVGNDACYGPAAVYEFYCKDGDLQTVIVDCPPSTSCHAGVCVGGKFI